MTQPFIPPARPLIGEEEIDAVAAVMRTGMIAQGPQVAAFEEEFCAALVPGTRAVAVNSGTSALHLGLLAAGIGPGDEVIVPSFTFAATANSVAITGATPVFADIDPLTFTLSPAAVEAAITPRTRAIMPVHPYGHPAPMDALQEIADAHGLMVFEDAAQAHGASLHGRAVGSFGAFAAFSFYPTKNMTSGEGGMVTSSDPEIIRGVKLARNQGMETRYANEIVGLNNRMTDLHAAIGRVHVRTTPPSWTPTCEASPSRTSRPALPTCITSTRSAWPKTATALPPPCARNTASARASTTRSRTTSCHPSPASPPAWSCRPRARPPTRFSPCRSTRP